MPAKAFPFHIMTKPIGPLCNLKCDYCFYLEKTSLYPDEKDFRMDDELLEEYIKQYIKYQPGPTVSFAWQGGEPTLMGLDFFKKVVELQQKYLPKGWQCENALQTNGTLLDDDWCQFLQKNNFLVGLSLDGPPNLHDTYRHNKQGKPVSEQVLKGLDNLKKHNVEYNVLCVVNNVNAKKPLEVYHYYKDLGIKYLQFIPLVEVLPDQTVSERSLAGEDYGYFLTQIFNEWVQEDLGDIYVQIFESVIGAAAGLGSSVCVFAPTCGKFLAMEHNGDLYACDHYVEPEYKLGNIQEKDISELVLSEQQEKFGRDKWDKLTKYCKQCHVLHYCNGACPKDRVAIAPTGEEGLSYLCVGYKQFFSYADIFAKELAGKLRARQGVVQMRAKASEIYKQIWEKVGRNDLCPCKSGKKFKKCCTR